MNGFNKYYYDELLITKAKKQNKQIFFRKSESLNGRCCNPDSVEFQNKPAFIMSKFSVSCNLNPLAMWKIVKDHTKNIKAVT